jgi:hypothetical protein
MGIDIDHWYVVFWFFFGGQDSDCLFWNQLLLHFNTCPKVGQCRMCTAALKGFSECRTCIIQAEFVRVRSLGRQCTAFGMTIASHKLTPALLDRSKQLLGLTQQVLVRFLGWFLQLAICGLLPFLLL